MNIICEEFFNDGKTHLVSKTLLKGTVKRTHEYDWVGSHEDRDALMSQVMKYFTGSSSSLLFPPVWKDNRNRSMIKEQSELKKRSIEEIGQHLVLNYHGFSKFMFLI